MRHFQKASKDRVKLNKRVNRSFPPFQNNPEGNRDKIIKNDSPLMAIK